MHLEITVFLSNSMMEPLKIRWKRVNDDFMAPSFQPFFFLIRTRITGLHAIFFRFFVLPWLLVCSYFLFLRHDLWRPKICEIYNIWGWTFFYEILNLKTLFLFFRSLRYWHFWHFFPVVKDKHPVKSLVIGRPILLAIEDVDGSPSFLEKALRFIEDHGGFPFPLCLLLPFLVHISGLLPFPISSMDSFILWLRDKTGNTWDSIVLVFFLLWYTRIWSFMLSVVN